MTLTIELTSEQEARIQAQAQAVGVDPAAFVLRLIDEVSSLPPTRDMAAHLRAIGVIGAVKGAPRADGRAWSEIEAACDAD